jgi:predicted signal transduction protein with EAL and GGDEF domain
VAWAGGVENVDVVIRQYSPFFVAVGCPVVLLLLSNVRILCWLVVFHGSHIWSLVAG